MLRLEKAMRRVRSMVLLLGVFCLCVSCTRALQAQELSARVFINTDLMPNTSDKSIFLKLQSDLSFFLNNTKWTKDVFDYYEKINCTFFINLEQIIDVNTYTASVIVQASRPIYNVVYQSTLLNLTDREFTFMYSNNQNIEFNEFRVQGTNPLMANLPAFFAYYAYLIVGLHYNSFELKAGYPYFQKAQNIVNNYPDHRYISGWNAYNSRRNRYWLVEALTNVNYNLIHTGYYTYYREGLDMIVSNPNDARKKILKALNLLSTIARDNPQNLSVLPLFVQGKTEELIALFKEEGADTKKTFLALIESIDVNNLIRYKKEIVIE